MTLEEQIQKLTNERDAALKACAEMRDALGHLKAADMEWGDAMALADHADVVKLLKEKIRRQRKTISCLRFSYLIGNTEWFGEDLGEVQANNRGPVRCADRESVLKSTGRIEQVKDTVRSAADILAGMKAFEEFRALKASL